MRKIRFIASCATFVAAALVTAAALMLAACSNVLAEKPESQSAIPAGFGTVQVRAGIQDAARTALPTAPTGFNHYEYWFAKDEAAAAQETADEDGTFYLEAGSYTVLVKGFATADAGSLAGQGTSASFAVSAGQDAGTVNVTLGPIDNDGDGTLSYTLKYPEGVTVETYSITVLTGGETDLKSGADTATEDGVTTLSGSKTVGAGYYYLQVSLSRADGAVAGKAEVVYIYRGLTTETATAEYTFTVGEFITPGTVNTTADTDENNVGSLRWAITQNNASTSGGTIIISLPEGSVIELTSVLPAITKSLTIEGNGLTLTRASSWTSSDSSQLLYINSTNVAVTIRRVHFKDGLATTYGGAIRNAGGTLTVESCIFSGNRITNADTNGGAIYSNGVAITTIKGSTFYNNTAIAAGAAGGAIFIANDGTLTLTGNLFYGNTATSTPKIVCTVGSPTMVTTYNVVDLAYGGSNAGWYAGTGDTLFSTLGISSDPFNATSIKPSDATNLGKLQIVPTETAGFPATDFSGAARTVVSGKTVAGAWSTAE
jgi:hypothetical protein